MPRDASHASGSLDEASALLVAHPAIADHDIHTAAILGDDTAVGRWLARDPASATVRGGPRDWDPLTYLCFSRFLRLDPARGDGFVRAARALLDAGASARTGFWEPNHLPEPEWESVLYGAAGIAHHAELTRLLLAYGADPNDGEVVYHTPESYDNGALQALVEGGRLDSDSLTTMLIRKHDWHDLEGVRYLLDHGADPNDRGRWGGTALHHAIIRDNGAVVIELLLDHGADPAILADGQTAVEQAARRGRGDLLALFAMRGVPVALAGAARLVAACARNDAATIGAVARDEPQVVRDVMAQGGRLLAEFAGNGNTDGVRQLLDLGVDVTARFATGDGYWDVAPGSTALHVAAWRARHATVQLLIDRGAPVNATDGRGRTPLTLAVRACVDSYWTELRSPESVAALLATGASPLEAAYPSGYAEVDELLREFGRET